MTTKKKHPIAALKIALAVLPVILATISAESEK
jgi:hypothetical protein